MLGTEVQKIARMRVLTPSIVKRRIDATSSATPMMLLPFQTSSISSIILQRS
jgi:hypothetical protein